MASANGSNLRFGILGAARIAPAALVDPATRLEVDVVAVAARDIERAKAFGSAHGVASALGSYDELLERDDLDAMYIPLPAALRHEWTMRALARGLHVLAEKPLGIDAAQAQEMVEEAEARGLVLVDGFHYQFHPMMERAIELLSAGALGQVEHLEATFNGAIPRDETSRVYLDPALGGGTALHQGCYALHALRSLMGKEPTVVRAASLIGDTGVDETMDVELVFDGGVTGRARSSFARDAALLMHAVVRGSRATMELDNFIGPHYGHLDPKMAGRLRLTTIEGSVELDERFTGESTYLLQLRAFCQAVHDGVALPGQGRAAVANMALIDEVRAAARIERVARGGGFEPGDS